MTPILISPPAVEPVSLAEAKEWLRLDQSTEDDLVAALITSARMIVETATRRKLITQTWRLAYDRWPSRRPRREALVPRPEIITLPLAPVQSALAVRVFDINRAAQTVTAATYAMVAAPEQARLVFVLAPPPPGTPFAGIEIDVVCGYGDQPASVPEPLRLAIKMLTARWFENRGDVESDAAVDRLPSPIAALIAPYRRARLR